MAIAVLLGASGGGGSSDGQVPLLRDGGALVGVAAGDGTPREQLIGIAEVATANLAP